MNLDNLFDIAHVDVLDRMKIEEDKIFLQRQREQGRPGCLAGVDKKLAEKEERTRQRKIGEEKKDSGIFHWRLHRHRTSYYYLKNYTIVLSALTKA